MTTTITPNPNDTPEIRKFCELIGITIEDLDDRLGIYFKDDLVKFPNGIKFGGYVLVVECPNFAHVGDDNMFNGSLTIEGCPNFVGFGKSTVVNGGVYIKDCPSLMGFGENPILRGDVSVANCPIYNPATTGLEYLLVFSSANTKPRMVI